MVSKQIKIELPKSIPAKLKIAIDAAEGAVNLIKHSFTKKTGVISLEGKDIKTRADISSHVFLCDELSKTNIPIFSEEMSDSRSFNLQKEQWIIDPIDGTLNYYRGFPMAAISVALWDKGIPILGVVRNLFNDNIFYSYNKFGSWFNNQKIKVSEIKKVPEAILATGFPTGSNHDSYTLKKIVNDIQSYKKLRMLGSAALMLCYVSNGVFDVYSENDIYIWDVAAGLSIISEAGGKYIIDPGSSVSKYNIIASNKYLMEKLSC